ncbi:nucleophile aminohydrolase [Chytridium lagenaria]|nr:nucleophile aminohydrolase [Chytridium lagenaria]
MYYRLSVASDTTPSTFTTTTSDTTSDTTLAINAVAAAIACLESSAETNCGLGSNLNLIGKVECDASIMEGHQGGFGSVASVQGLRNPILAAKMVLAHDLKGRGALGRIPAVMLVGEGARVWCADRGAEVCGEHDLVTEDALRMWQKALAALRMVANQDEQISQGFDTVGAVAIDHMEISQREFLVESAGRVGHAAIFGSGVWASNPHNDTPGFGCSLSGTGEQIIKTQFASKLAELFTNPHNDSLQAIQKGLDAFLTSPFLRYDDKKSAGFIAVKAVPTDEETLRVEICVAHTTESMCVGWMSARDGKVKTKWSVKAVESETKIEMLSL